MKLLDLRQKEKEVLEKELREAQGELASLRSKLASRQLTNTREIRKMRKVIARLKTILREKQVNKEKNLTS
ncbi:50S ribosomal protein L29 [Candidatus Uhrbacteria bacterium CG_4_9_14_3_um_filter_36_7]|uniref:Large ribosomal subunit protein uL29 n=1 Tax=Candidatus Uhrbacteria bacterium CG_4_9_14_3_um_filter_36_7 TaxID=1975033 RepID=A0A2M7XHI3_9BACT|nr:MAG: 50S ribosomal protein L29 [Candidatus Uhrbacteria bacterium CG_4_9_14_3_um_filter_36_7]